MNIERLNERPETDGDEKLQSDYRRLVAILQALADRDGPEEVAGRINSEVERVNAVSGSTKEIRSGVRAAYTTIVQIAEKELNLVPRDHYRTLWTGLGLAVFGIPLGAAFGVALGNMALLGAGLPIGLAIGVGVGTNLDRKAAAEGRQLDIDE